MTRKSPEKENLAKGNNSRKSELNPTKFKLDLYYVKTKSYTKYKFKITEDEKEKSRKPNFCKGQ